MRLIALIVSSLALIIQTIDAYKILVVAPMPAKSHHILMSSLAKGLAEAGNDVTIVDPIKDNYVTKNKNGSYTEIELTGIVQEAGGRKVNFFDFSNMNPIVGNIMTGLFTLENTESFFQHPNVQALLKSGSKFDVVIIEQFVNDALKGIAYHFDAPLIMFSTIPPGMWTNPMVGNPSPPSYIPELWTTYSSKMTFLERVMNTFIRLMAELQHHLFMLPKHNALMKKYLPNVPDLNVIYHNVSLILVNAHDSLNQAVPYVPSMVQIGGFHVSPPKKLPVDLQKYMDAAKDGVIYFSLGSNIQPSQMKEDTKQAIIQALSKFKKYKVLWKWDEDIVGLPENFKLSKWFPQQEVLAHPNVKLFITHGGQLSTTETIYHGVPILAIPVFGDQHSNAIRAEIGGYGLVLRYADITEELLTEKVKALLTDPKYMQNVKMRSTFLHDRPVKPLDLAIYWTEFIARYKGAPHLRIAGLDLAWYQYLLLDVAIFYLVVIIASAWGTCLLLKRVCCSKRNQKVKTN